METFDYIVVGGGSAGCTVTHRLIKAGKSVLVIEAGPDDNNQFVHMPGGFVRLFSTERVQFYLSEPQAAAGDRPIAVPQGRTLGGGSSVNAMIYIRGTSHDYDEWRDLGCAGWGWDDVLPVFKRAESNQRLAGPFHGTDGPLPVSDARLPSSAELRRPARGAGSAAIPTTTISTARPSRASASIRSRSATPCAVRPPRAICARSWATPSSRS